jgi:predicted porin
MKKSLLALAVLGAFAGAASAQTNVTIYGIADVGIQRAKTSGAATGNGTTWGLESGIWSGSRLGFKGSEDLGGGMSAIFTLENGYLIDTGRIDQAGQLFGRQAWVGLNGGFGAVKFGRQYTPMFQAIDSIDPFETGLAGNALTTFESFGLRMDNTINYSLPSNLGGFYGQIGYGLGEVAGDNGANRQLGLSVGYANGPINAVVAYHDRNNVTDTGGDNATFLGATYDFGVAKIHAAFQNGKLDNPAPAADRKNRSYMIGASAPVGAGRVLASFQRADDRDSDANIDAWALGYTYGLSKRTDLYTSLGQTKTEVPNTADIDTDVFNVGIRHKF